MRAFRPAKVEFGDDPHTDRRASSLMPSSVWLADRFEGWHQGAPPLALAAFGEEVSRKKAEWRKSMTLQRFTAAIAAMVFAIITATASIAAPDASPINTLDGKGVAIKGYDPVAYFTEGAPRKGKPEFAAQHRGTAWHFASAQNKAAFEAAPDKYVPVYGGYCAYGVAQGYLVKIEPDAWAIRDGKLYLNYDKSVQKMWSEKPAEYIKTADQKWPGLIAEK